MIRLNRPACPECLQEKGKKWAEKYAESRKRYKIPPFRWAQYKGTSVNHLLLPILMGMSKGHCAYCDGYELGAVSRETIDHFRPKSIFPHLSYDWDNLFPACDACQAARNEHFDESILKPDDREYAFVLFFTIDYATGRLKPNPGADPEDQKRAEVTIRLFGLNRSALVSSRLRAVRDLANVSLLPMGERPFRFLYDDCPS